ncbi:hypothetical protein FHT77_000930 [Rhizobium sp. BK181]|uniref:hypothetical protein n=1 Tax=Rhizobium sp. BK181 TaxID=2587072 RepID=UPI0016207570|nr:hypothetical protein [Rhizobium sp. BK181]MBB3315088.1 hypothetical protein [Rhizobium sp. BK181]
MLTPEEEHRRQQLEWLRGDAHIAHEAQRKSMGDNLGIVGSFSTAAMRAPALAAAGAIAALLGFFSANYRAISGTVGQQFFNDALFLFAASVLMTVLAPGLAYFSQYSFMWSLAKEELHWERPFVRSTKAAKRLNAVGVAIQVLAVFFTLSSIVLLVLGGISFLHLARYVSEVGTLPQIAVPV